MMHSWWEFGESTGNSGEKLALYQLECPFCGEIGNYALEHHAERKKPNGSKLLNFDTYKCGNCTGYIQVFWSANENSHGFGIHDYKVQPWPIGVVKTSEHWPKKVARFWKQAHNALKKNDLDAAVVMGRSALQTVMRDKGALGGRLIEQIEDLTQKGILTTILKDWAHELRLLANESAHPNPEIEDDELLDEDVEDVIEFLDFLLIYSYDLPKQIEAFKSRKK